MLVVFVPLCVIKKNSFSFLFFSVYFCCAVNVSLQFDKDFFEFACLYESNLFQFVWLHLNPFESKYFDFPCYA